MVAQGFAGQGQTPFVSALSDGTCSSKRETVADWRIRTTLAFSAKSTLAEIAPI
jgi:hypothetical protein